MPNTEYQFRPCDCCIEPSSSVGIEFDVYYRFCEACGAKSESDEDSRVQQAQCNFPEPDLSPWPIKNSVNAPNNPFLKYENQIFQESWSRYPCGPPISSSWFRTTFEYSGNISNCNFTQENEGSEGCCPGQSRDSWLISSNVITDCSYEDWISVNFFPIANAVSRYGDIRLQSKHRFRVVHSPTWSCYLKVWFRIKLEKFPLVDGTNFNFQSSGGEFLGYEDLGSYEWEGSGRPCFEDQDKPYFEPENRIIEEEWREYIPVFEIDAATAEAFGAWAADLSEGVSGFSQSSPSGSFDDIPNVSQKGQPPVSLGGRLVGSFEWKYSTIKDYEPDWP